MQNKIAKFAAISICILIIPNTNTLSDLTPVSGLGEYCTKPVQAYLCDIAGVGVVIESQPTWFNVAISNVWFGTPTGNVMRIEVLDSSPPVTNAPIVFLAATNAFFKGEIFDSISYLCSWSFLTNRSVHPSVINNYTNSFSSWNLIGDQLSWFYQDEDNGATFTYVSNLVFKARVQQNHEAVYEYLRTQADTNAVPTRKIWIDTRFTFINWSCSGPNSFRHKMIDDPLLPFYIRKWGSFYLREE